MRRVTREQMAEVDRLVPEKYGITVGKLMENAGYQLADFLRQNFSGEKISFYIGKGHNGGDGLVAARRLEQWGFDVELVLVTEQLEGIVGEEFETLQKLGVETVEEASGEVAVDALIGYSLEGAPRPPFDGLVESVNEHGTVVSVDIPTGVDADTGEKFEPCVEPDYTVTFGLPFQGIDEQNAGEVWIADISIPGEAYEEAGVETGDMFSDSSLVGL
ncbi:MAG: NAD(P)H-hydrate epimerase [Candidatus Nanohaloarchaea archaeon]